ncbi:MAG TPA: hypothetical protein PJ986_15535 [Gammaproteobacteria bacterium]|nr:hypothetical protein [Gammaproteobacteria bacterium]
MMGFFILPVSGSSSSQALAKILAVRLNDGRDVVASQGIPNGIGAGICVAALSR